MARLSLNFPEDQYCYATHLTVRVNDINRANHLGNDSMISMISEARARFLFEFGISESAEDGTGIINEGKRPQLGATPGPSPRFESGRFSALSPPAALQ
ncbi:hypothetical protein D9M69_697960 [compost metagenome]